MSGGSSAALLLGHQSTHATRADCTRGRPVPDRWSREMTRNSRGSYVAPTRLRLPARPADRNPAPVRRSSGQRSRVGGIAGRLSPCACRFYGSMPDATIQPEAADYLDARWHRALLDELCAFGRETASAGERAAAEWLLERLVAEDVGEARIEEHRGHQTFWWPLGLAAAGGVLAGWWASRGSRLGAAALGAAAAWAAADELPPRRRRLRAALPRRTATNVVANCGPTEARRTIVIVAHHDAAHSGLVFSPAIPERDRARRPSVLRGHADESPTRLAGGDRASAGRSGRR